MEPSAFASERGCAKLRPRAQAISCWAAVADILVIEDEVSPLESAGRTCWTPGYAARFQVFDGPGEIGRITLAAVRDEPLRP